jgi:hypothetical protein
MVSNPDSAAHSHVTEQLHCSFQLSVVFPEMKVMTHAFQWYSADSMIPACDCLLWALEGQKSSAFLSTHVLFLGNFQQLVKARLWMIVKDTGMGRFLESHSILV